MDWLVSHLSIHPSHPLTWHQIPVSLPRITSPVLSPHNWVVLTPSSAQMGIGSGPPIRVLYSPQRWLCVPGCVFELTGANRLTQPRLWFKLGEGKLSFLLNLAILLLTWELQVCEWRGRGGEKNGKRLGSKVWVTSSEAVCPDIWQNMHSLCFSQIEQG